MVCGCRLDVLRNWPGAVSALALGLCMMRIIGTWLIAAVVICGYLLLSHLAACEAAMC
jgi:hypothetical protein